MTQHGSIQFSKALLKQHISDQRSVQMHNKQVLCIEREQTTLNDKNVQKNKSEHT